MLLEINRLNFEHYQIKLWTERKSVKGGANPGIEPIPRETSDHDRDRNISRIGRILYSHSYRKGLSSLARYPGPVELAGTLSERLFQLLDSFVDGFPAAGLSALTSWSPRPT